MDHDFATQKAETFSVYADLQAGHGLPDEADIDYFFVPLDAAADWRPLAEALGRVERIGPFESAGLAEAASPARHVESLIAICEEMLGRPA